MKRIISIIMAMAMGALLLSACGTADPEAGVTETEATETVIETTETAEPAETEKAERDTIRLATLKGPTTMGLVKLLDDAENGELAYDVDNEIYGAADELIALIISGELDAAAIPCNLASILYNKTEGKIQVAAINTTGVLNVLELGDSIGSVLDLKGKTVYSVGKGTTPEYALNAILAGNDINPTVDLTVEFKSEATEIAALLSGENAEAGTIAVLPQPYATTVLMNNPDARIALSFDEEWRNAGFDGDMVTGVLVVSREFAENNSETLESFLADYSSSATWVNENAEDAAELIAAAGIVPKAPVAQKALPYCGIAFKSGADMKTDISTYLNALFEQDPKAVGGALPDDGFYYGA